MEEITTEVIWGKVMKRGLIKRGKFERYRKKGER
jgi:hypothetical protein